MMDQLTTDDANRVLAIIKDICAQIGPGLPGTAQEKERAETIKGELASHLGDENVSVEEFAFAPDAFLAAYPISAVMIMLSALCNQLTGRLPEVSLPAAVAGFLLAIMAVVVIGVEFIQGYEFLDPLFPKKVSVNVIGTLRRPGDDLITRLLIVSGHHDSAPENTWLSLLGYGFIPATLIWFLGYAVVILAGLLQVAGVISGNAAVLQVGTLGWALLVFPVLPSILYALFFSRKGRGGGIVPGAADNLSASALLPGIARYLVNHPGTIPAGTEIRFISFGSEEAGYRGSRRYVERHAGELECLDSHVLNFETLVSTEFTILSSDRSGYVKNSPEMVNSLVHAAERAGVPYLVKSASTGVANDSGPFSKVNLKAATVLGMKMPQHMVAFYHQKKDVPEILIAEPILNALKLAVEWISQAGI